MQVRAPPSSLFLSWVRCSAVEFQGTESPKNSTTDDACIAPFDGVDFAVVGERGAVSEGFPTLWAHVGHLPSVHALVPLDAGLAQEGLPAIFAAV